MSVLLDIFAGIGIVLLIILFLRWLFSPTGGRRERMSEHDKAATLWYLLTHDHDDEGKKGHS